MLNRVIGLGMDSPAKPDEIDAFVASYRQRKLPMTVSLCPEAAPTDIEDWLRSRGFVEHNRWVKMVRGTEPPPTFETDLRIERATDADEETVIQVVQGGFGMPASLAALFGCVLRAPGTRVYLAWADDESAAVGMLTVAGHLGHLSTAASLPRFRRRRAQAAIMARRNRDGIDEGVTRFVTETGVPTEGEHPSYNNMVRLGFRVAYERPNWVLHA